MGKRLIKEIGSFYEWEDVYKNWFQSLAEEKGHESFLTWLTERIGSYLNFFESGRSAISAALASIEEKVKRKVCLLPAYICDTVITPFVRRGWEIHFFQVNRQLFPNKRELEVLIRQHEPSVILVVPYYGVDTLCEVRSFLQEWRNTSKGFVIEDLTQSLFLLQPCGKEVDIQVFSIRKWLPIFGGGGYSSTNSISTFDIKPSDSCFINAKKKAQKLKWKYLNGEAINKESFLTLNYEAEAILDTITEINGMDLESYGILSVYDVELMRLSRIKNANILHQMVKNLNQIEKIISLEKDTVPLYYPIYTDNREKLQAFLQKRDIFAPVLWPIPELVQTYINEDVAYIYDHLLAIPCDHRYNETDMERIGIVLQEYERN